MWRPCCNLSGLKMCTVCLHCIRSFREKDPESTWNPAYFKSELFIQPLQTQVSKHTLIKKIDICCLLCPTDRWHPSYYLSVSGSICWTLAMPDRDICVIRAHWYSVWTWLASATAAAALLLPRSNGNLWGLQTKLGPRIYSVLLTRTLCSSCQVELIVVCWECTVELLLEWRQLENFYYCQYCQISMWHKSGIFQPWTW